MFDILQIFHQLAWPPLLKLIGITKKKRDKTDWAILYNVNIKRVGNVMLAVRNMEKSLEFYHNLIGLPIKEQRENWIDLGTGENSLISLHPASKTELQREFTWKWNYSWISSRRCAICRWWAKVKRSASLQRDHWERLWKKCHNVRSWWIFCITFWTHIKRQGYTDWQISRVCPSVVIKKASLDQLNWSSTRIFIQK